MDGRTGPAAEHELDDAGVDRALLYVREAPQQTEHPRVVGKALGSQLMDAWQQIGSQSGAEGPDHQLRVQEVLPPLPAPCLKPAPAILVLACHMTVVCRAHMEIMK